MRAMHKALVLTLAVVAGCQASTPKTTPNTTGAKANSSAKADGARTLSEDENQTTQGGAVFVAPAGFSVLSRKDVIELHGPEPDLHIAIVDATETSPDEAVAAGWKKIIPDFKVPLQLVRPRPARDGWDEIRAYSYETSPNDKRVVGASALKFHDRWTVVLVESSEASYEKRASFVARVSQSLHPKDFVRESFVGKKPKTLDADAIAAILKSVDHARERAQIPGVAIALVQDGKVVHAGGLGVRALGKPEKVDDRTRFIIASNTKALTTLLLAKLVDDKKLGWDTKVTSILPAFKLGDADTTSKVEVQHLVCACTGLPRQDFEWLLQYEKESPKKVVQVDLALTQPTTKFGEAYQYSNTLAAAAGYVAGYALTPNKEYGAAYDAAMKEKVFEPLGMTDTTFDFDLALRGNVAMPHDVDFDGKSAPAVMDLNKSIRAVRPAGGAWSTVRDMAKYVTMELAKGVLPDGKRYLSEEVLLERRKPKVAVSEFETYGMGLIVNHRWSIPVVHHGGDLIGYHSDMFWIPDANVGGVILTNGRGHLTRQAFLRKTLEVLYDGHSEADEDAESNVATYDAAVQAERSRLEIPPNPATVAKLAKAYVHPDVGEIKIDTVKHMIDFGGWKSPFATRPHDDGTVSIVTTVPGAMGFGFVVGQKDKKRTLVFRDMQHEYVFVEK